MASTVVLSGTQTIVNPKEDDDCKPNPAPPAPEPEKDCCCKTYHIVLNFN